METSAVPRIYALASWWTALEALPETRASLAGALGRVDTQDGNFASITFGSSDRTVTVRLD